MNSRGEPPLAKASKNQKTPKNCKTPNLKNEGVSPVREEQAAKCDCCERDCPVCKRLFVGAALAGSESCSLGAVTGDLAPDSEGEEPGDLCEFGCGNLLLAAVESRDGFRPVFLGEAPVSAPEGEALESL